MKSTISFLYAGCLLCLFLSTASTETYTRGHYVGLDDQRHDGQIAYKLGLHYVAFRENTRAEEVRFKPDDIRAFVWGVDSFIVREGNFVRVAVGEGPLRVYLRERTEEVTGTKTLDGKIHPGYGVIQRTFLIEQEGSQELLTVERKDKKFREQMSALFADAPDLVARIKSGEFGPGNVDRLVKAYNEMQKEK